MFDVAECARAQADLSGELAALCYLFGALEARLSPLGAGSRQRLAMREAAEMSWWVSTHTAQMPVSEERLTLWLGLRSQSALHDSLALQEAAWAARRLMAPPGLGVSDRMSVVDIQRFLGDACALQDDCDGAAMPRAHYLHPVTRSALLFHGWRSFGQGEAVQIEALVMAACLGG